MFLHITDVRHLQDYQLEVVFNDGSVRRVDLEKELYGEVFEPLKDKDFFRKVQLNAETGTIEWPNGADFAPECLHELGREVQPKLLRS